MMLMLFMRQAILERGVLFRVAAAVSAGLLVGIACLWMSPLWTLGIFAILVFGFAAVIWPEIPLLGYIDDDLNYYRW